MSPLPGAKPPEYGPGHVRASLRDAMRDRAHRGCCAQHTKALPDLVHVHPQTLEDLLKAVKMPEEVDAVRLHGASATLWGVPAVPTTHVLQERCLWVWHAPARQCPVLPGPPQPA